MGGKAKSLDARQIMCLVASVGLMTTSADAVVWDQACGLLPSGGHSSTMRSPSLRKRTKSAPSPGPPLTVRSGHAKHRGAPFPRANETTAAFTECCVSIIIMCLGQIITVISRYTCQQARAKRHMACVKNLH